MMSMNESIAVTDGGMELLPEVQPLWEALYDRHLEYGAAGLPTIERNESWPRRLVHYRHLFETHPHPIVFLARLHDQAVGYALGFEEEHEGHTAVVLESLSILPTARSRGLGTRLMTLLDDQARAYGAKFGLLDVVTGNTPAFDFYAHAGFAPYSETWMRSHRPNTPLRAFSNDFRIRAQEAGLELCITPGPDDTWVSSDAIASFTMVQPNQGVHPNENLLRELFYQTQAAGLWTIQVTLPSTHEQDPWRAALSELDFTPAMERLQRSL